MYVCMYVRIYIYTYIYMYVCVCVYIYIYMKSCNVSAVDQLNSVQTNLVILWGCLIKAGRVYWVGKK
jgi:hypothetical protein